MEKREAGLALRINRWVAAHYRRHHQPAAGEAPQPAATQPEPLLALLQGLEADSRVGEGTADSEWRPTVEQLFWWTFISQGPHAALAFLDGPDATNHFNEKEKEKEEEEGEVQGTEAPAVFIMVASCLVVHNPLLSADAARLQENFREWKLVLSRASRALEAFDAAAIAAASSSVATTMMTMAKVAALLLRCGGLMLEVPSWLAVEERFVVDKLVQEVLALSLRQSTTCDPDMVLAGLHLCKHKSPSHLLGLGQVEALLQHPEESIRHATAILDLTHLSGRDDFKACLARHFSQEPSARVREAIINAVLHYFNAGQEGALDLLLLGLQDEDARVALVAVDGFSSWVDEAITQHFLPRYLPQFVDVLVKHIALPDLKSLVALCVDCVVAHRRQHMQNQQVPSDIALLPVELQELIIKELARKPGPVKTAGQQHGTVGTYMYAPESDEPLGEQLRKASAMCLDLLSMDLAAEVLRVIPPMVRPDSPWQLRESGVFLMGIVAESMYDLWDPSAVKQLLRHFNAAAIPSLAAPQPKLREIACWTVSRFARSVLDSSHAAGRGQDIDGRAAVDSLLEIMRSDPHVHAAVMSALATLVEQGLFSQMPERGRALLDNCIVMLGHNPSGHLLDLISTCFESADVTSIVDVELEQRLAPLLLDALERAVLALDLSNRSAVEHLDMALTAVANLVASVKDRFEPFVERIAGQIERVLAHQATTAAATEAGNQLQLAGACMDLCSRLLAEGCDLSRFISPARLVASAGLPSQEGFALVGEMAKLGLGPLKDSLPHIEASLAAVFAQRQERDPVHLNAEWAAGQLARHLATGLQLPWVDSFLGLSRYGSRNRTETLLLLGLHHAHALPASLVRRALTTWIFNFTPDQEPWEQIRAEIVVGFPNLVLRCLASPTGGGLQLSESEARALLVFFVQQIDWLCCHAPEAESSPAGGSAIDEDEQRVSDALNAIVAAAESNVEQVVAWFDVTSAAEDGSERARWRAIVEHYVVGAGCGSGGRHYMPLLLALQRTSCPP